MPRAENKNVIQADPHRPNPTPEGLAVSTFTMRVAVNASGSELRQSHAAICGCKQFSRPFHPRPATYISWNNGTMRRSLDLLAVIEEERRFAREPRGETTFRAPAQGKSRRSRCATWCRGDR